MTDPQMPSLPDPLSPWKKTVDVSTAGGGCSPQHAASYNAGRITKFFFRSTVEQIIRAFQRQPEFSLRSLPWPRPRYHSLRFSKLHPAGLGWIASERSFTRGVAGATSSREPGRE